jgi:hypothetical protein
MASFNPPQQSFERGCDRCHRSRSTLGVESQTWWCIDCGLLLCDNCWPRELSHQQGRTNRDGLAHEKTNPRIHRTLKDIFRPQFDEDTLDMLHEKDEETTWFG